jgi:DNA-binding MarR family transcriptional regulator
LSDAAETLLADVVEDEFMPLTARYELFADREEGVAAKDELVSAGLVAERTVKGIQAGKRVLLELTEAGREYVDEETELEVEQEGRGGVVHRFWQHQIKAVIEEAGWSASLEASDADIWTVMDGTELAVEVAMGDNEREVDHVDKHLEQGFDTIWIACPTQEIENGLEMRLADHGVRDAVVFKRLAEFLNPEQAADSVASTAE